MTSAGASIPTGEAPDPIAYYELYRGVAWKRAVAYLFDLVVIGFFMAIAAGIFLFIGMMTFGLLHPLLIFLFSLIPFCYHTLLLSGPHHATIGMRIFGLEMRSITLGYPDTAQAAIQTVLFYMSVALTVWLLILWALFDPRRRMLHDILAGTYVVNRRAGLGVPA
jgi:uncharacterized RDD family membrane protein YckC